MNKVIDPVCKMEMETGCDTLNYTYQHKTDHFCSNSCLNTFKNNPQKYLREQNNTGADTLTDEDVVYYCPMLCEGDKVYPEEGSCPECGMALIPAGVNVGEKEEKHDYYLNLKKLLFSALFTIPVFVLAMGDMLFKHQNEGIFSFLLGGIHNLQYLQLILSVPVCIFIACSIYRKMILSFKTLRFNMFSLIGAGALIAFLYSLTGTLLPKIFPAAMLTNGVADVHFETAVVIIMFFYLGQVLEKKSQFTTRQALKGLMDLAGKTAILIKDGENVHIEVDHIKVGDRLRIRQGDKIPVDGILEEGSLSIDEASVTGESLPVSKKERDELIGGTVNISGNAVMKVINLPENSLLKQIIKTTLEAQKSKTKIQRIADKVSKFFVPAVIGLVVITFFCWLFLDKTAPLSHAILTSVSILVIACPCALGLATPMAITVATSRASGLGFLFRNAAALENLAKIKVLVTDKTGTLTEGKPQVCNSYIQNKRYENEVLNHIFQIEKNSSHPLAKALLNYIQEKSIKRSDLKFDQVDEIAGKGICAKNSNDSFFIGNIKTTEIDCLEQQAKDFANEALRENAVLIQFNSKKYGIALFSLKDTLKKSSYKAVELLKKRGVKVIMATGDNEKTARDTANQLGIEQFFHRVKPTDKLEIVKTLQKEGLVAMMGDGINDVPTLSQADVSIAMASGSDIVIHSSDMILFKNDLSKIQNALELSKKTIKVIKENLFFSFVYNSVGIILTSGLLYPLWGFLLNPVIAALAMALSSVSVILSSLRLNLFKIT